MNTAVRAANAFDRVVLRIATMQYDMERHDLSTPKTYAASLREVMAAAREVTEEVPGLIDAIAPYLDTASVERWRTCAALAAAAGDITETVSIIRVLSPLLPPTPARSKVLATSRA